MTTETLTAPLPTSPTPVLDAMSAQHRRYCWAFATGGNGTQAAVASGYSVKSAGQAACRLNKSPKILDGIAEAKLVLASGSDQVSAERVLKEFARLAFSDATAVFDGKLSLDTLTMRDIDALTDDQKATISAIKVTTDSEGKKVVEVKFHSKIKALEALARCLGMFDEALNVKLQLMPVLGHANFGSADKPAHLPGGVLELAGKGKTQVVESA